MIKNDFNYKWSKLFAAKRWDTDGEITLTPIEQQELLYDCEKLVKKLSIAPISLDEQSEATVCELCNGDL
tara:strand:+ start:410 stop:619 length:210 start_codon:yes stop_codon:yes gene_type:complete